MPSVSHRAGSRHRRTINEINMVPFIDVMLVLLVIFMVTAPLITTGLVDLPSVGQAKRKPEHASAPDPQQVAACHLQVRIAKVAASAASNFEHKVAG